MRFLGSGKPFWAKKFPRLSAGKSFVSKLYAGVNYLHNAHIENKMSAVELIFNRHSAFADYNLVSVLLPGAAGLAACGNCAVGVKSKD